jgi:hypothetical protein
MIGKRIRDMKGSYKEENTAFHSASYLFKIVELLINDSEDLKISMESLRFNKQLFWNLIYYFNDYMLPYDFILPYEDTHLFDSQFEELKQMGES